MPDKPSLTVLGLESSCDETAAAVVRGHDPGSAEILSNVIASQFDDHEAYGVVVPEIAARAHAERMDGIISKSMEMAGVTIDELDAISVTAGPGLIGGVMVGLVSAKAMHIAHGLPLVPVNHLEAHALTVRMQNDTDFPYLLLLVSGGHTQLLMVRGVGDYTRLGTTIDDAAGEAFDKGAQLLGLPAPGGPNLEKLARDGDGRGIKLPRPLLKRQDCDFSFSGLKTAMRLMVEDRETALKKTDMAAAYQRAIATHLAAKTSHAMDRIANGTTILVVAGGVAANSEVRSALVNATSEKGFSLVVPDAALCTDNGAMVAWAGIEHLQAGTNSGMSDPLQVAARPRWPLDENPEGKRHGGGKKGPKA